MAKAPQKSKDAKAKAAAGGGKKSKKKWSKGKSRDKLQNMCLFDKPTYDKVLKEVPNYKVCTGIFYGTCITFESVHFCNFVWLSKYLGHHPINRFRQNEDPWFIGSTCHQATSSRRQNQARNSSKLHSKNNFYLAWTRDPWTLTSWSAQKFSTFREF